MEAGSETVLNDRVVKDSDASAMRVIDLAPPTCGFSNGEVVQLAQGKKVEAILVIAFTDAGIHRTYYPGHGTDSVPWAKAEAMLIDVNASSIAWQGNTSSRADWFGNRDRIRASAGSELVSRLLELRFLRQARK